MTTKKMNQRVLRLWTEALRSGNYKQGQQRLRADDTYCCLGVLADVYCKDVGEDWPKQWNARGYLPTVACSRS